MLNSESLGQTKQDHNLIIYVSALETRKEVCPTQKSREAFIKQVKAESRKKEKKKWNWVLNYWDSIVLADYFAREEREKYITHIWEVTSYPTYYMLYLHTLERLEWNIMNRKEAISGNHKDGFASIIVLLIE